jgi:CBS-domain-containing membrane protein
MHARDIMTREVIAIGPRATARDAARKLARCNISGMPVVDDEGQLLGILTQLDLADREGATVAELMTPQVVPVSEDATVEEVARILTANRFKRVPVLRNGRVVGIISRSDIVRMMASRWVCTVCGHIELGALPRDCPSCGVDSSRFERELNVRPEITSRQ